MIQNIEKKIRQIRELKNLSQEYLADRLNLSIRANSKIECGETQLTINRLNEISDALGVTPQEILSFDEKHIFNNNPVNQQGGEYVAYNNTEIKQVQALYEKLLAEKERVIRLLEREIGGKK